MNIMNFPSRPLTLTALATIIAAGAGAQAPSSMPATTNPAVFTNPAANASAALNNGGNPAAAIGAAQLNHQAATNTGTLATGNAGTIGINGQTGNNAAASSVNGVDTVGTLQNAESIGMRRERLRANGALEEPGIVAAPETVYSEATSFDSTQFAGDIRSASLGARDELGAQLDRNIESGDRALASARSQAENLDGAARGQFEAALQRANAAENRLHQSLRFAQAATPDTWERARANLAADYEVYSGAIAQAQQIAAANAASSAVDPRHGRR